MDELNGSQMNDFLKLKSFPHISYSIIVTIGIVLLMAVGQAGLLMIIPDHLLDVLKPYAIGITQLCLMLIPVILTADKSPLTTKDIFRLKHNIPPKFFLISIAGLLSIQFFFYGSMSVQEVLIPNYLRDIYELLKTEFEDIYLSILAGEGVLDVLRALVIGAAIPAITEEVLFRGFLQRSLEVRLSPFWAITISSLIFGFIHFNPINLIPLIGIGYFLGYIAFLTRSIAIPIALHFLNNAIAIYTIYYAPAGELSSQFESLSVSTGIIVALFGIAATVAATLYISKMAKQYFQSEQRL